ncbi:MAG TPA: hypothetical protein DCF87_02290 [Opitutae bacterium]|nr:hypothetical protein [Opitutae bacterium]
MDTLKQKALDYTLGVLPKEDSLLFEAQVEEDDDARKFLVEAQEDCASLSMTATPASLSNEVRSRVMEYCEPKMDFDPFLSTNDISRLRNNFSSPENRYQGGDASVEINDVQEGAIKDEVLTSYDHLLNLLPMISGNSRAAAGEFDGLQSVLRSKPSLSERVDQILGHDLKSENPATRSVLRTTLATLPSLSFFSDRLREDQANLADTRRLFYLCRDQLKIMRASFKDLDPQRLIEDEKLRLHGAGLLQTKWWGAEHAYFSSKGQVKCGHFFDGPVTERCVEFAEYDANMYCLANLLAPRSSTGDFHMELLKDAIPGATLAVATAKMSEQEHQSLQQVITGSSVTAGTALQDHYLWKLIEDSMLRGHQSTDLKELQERKIYGINRLNDFTYLWFAWPAVL